MGDPPDLIAGTDGSQQLVVLSVVAVRDSNSYENN